MSASLTILGTAGGGPIPHRAKSGVLVRVDNRLSLLDCGGGVYQRMVDYGYDFCSLDRAFVSHTHPDHMSDLPLIVQAIYLTGRPEPFEIYVPQEFVKPCRNLLSAVYLFPDRFPCPLKVVGYGDRFMLQGKFHLTAIANSHLAKFRTRETESGTVGGECYSFILELANKRILYSSDIGSLDDLIPHWSGCDYVILEAAHIEWGRFWAEAKQARVGQFIITHFLSEAQAFQIQQNARAHGIANLQTAHDGLSVSF